MFEKRIQRTSFHVLLKSVVLWEGKALEDKKSQVLFCTEEWTNILAQYRRGGHGHC